VAGQDPDPLPPVPAETLQRLVPPAGTTFQRVALVALGEGRKLIGPLVAATSCAAIDIVLEEWATRKDERPPLPEGMTLPAVLTEKGDPQLGPEPIDAVYFLDSYHLLFHGPALLERLRERMADGGRVYVLDRRASRDDMPHREASHRRMIAPQLVRDEMTRAGFVLVSEEPPPGEGRFLLVFAKGEQPAKRAAERVSAGTVKTD
jgi:hypothetical protein